MAILKVNKVVKKIEIRDFMDLSWIMENVFEKTETSEGAELVVFVRNVRFTCLVVQVR